MSKVSREITQKAWRNNIIYMYTPPRTAAARVVVSIKRYYIVLCRCRVNISSMFSQCIFVFRARTRWRRSLLLLFFFLRPHYIHLQ